MRLNSREEEKGEAASILEGAREFGLLTAVDPPPTPGQVQPGSWGQKRQEVAVRRPLSPALMPGAAR